MCVMVVFTSLLIVSLSQGDAEFHGRTLSVLRLAQSLLYPCQVTSPTRQRKQAAVY